MGHGKKKQKRLAEFQRVEVELTEAEVKAEAEGYRIDYELGPCRKCGGTQAWAPAEAVPIHLAAALELPELLKVVTRCVWCENWEIQDYYTAN